MSELLIVFFTGIGGVFVGMAFLYITIKINRLLVRSFERIKEDK